MQCMKNDLVSTDEIFVDATHVKAAASRKKSKKILVAKKNSRFYDDMLREEMMLSRLVDTFFSRISLTMPLPPKFHNTAYVLLWEEDLHWQSRSSGCSSS